MSTPPTEENGDSHCGVHTLETAAVEVPEMDQHFQNGPHESAPSKLSFWHSSSSRALQDHVAMKEWDVVGKKKAVLPPTSCITTNARLATNQLVHNKAAACIQRCYVGHRARSYVRNIRVLITDYIHELAVASLSEESLLLTTSVLDELTPAIVQLRKRNGRCCVASVCAGVSK